MQFNAVLLMVTTTLALAFGCANAETITYQFKGKVTYGGNMAVAGSPIIGAFAIDRKIVGGNVPFNKAYQTDFFDMPANVGISAKVGPHTFSAGSLRVVLYNNLGGNVEDMIQIYGMSPPVVDGTSFPDGIFGFVLASGLGSKKALKDLEIPKKFDVEKFDGGPTLNYGFLQSSGYEGGTLLQFSVDAIKVHETAHEPK